MFCVDWESGSNCYKRVAQTLGDIQRVVNSGETCIWVLLTILISVKWCQEKVGGNANVSSEPQITHDDCFNNDCFFPTFLSCCFKETKERKIWFLRN